MTETKRTNSSTFFGEQSRQGPIEEQEQYNYLCTGGLSNALFILLLIGVGGGGGLSLLPSPYPNLTYTAAAKPIQANSQQTVQNTEYRIQTLMYIKLSVYMFFLYGD